MANDFKRTIGNAITRAEANEMIKKYDNEHRKDKHKDAKSVFYGRDLIEKILGQSTEVTGITFFLAAKNNPWAGKDTVQLVLVGTKEDGTLLWPVDGAGKDDAGGTAGDNGLTCPPSCPTPLPTNG
jgi:hypothetical protein